MHCCLHWSRPPWHGEDRVSLAQCPGAGGFREAGRRWGGSRQCASFSSLKEQGDAPWPHLFPEDRPQRVKYSLRGMLSWQKADIYSKKKKDRRKKNFSKKQSKRLGPVHRRIEQRLHPDSQFYAFPQPPHKSLQFPLVFPVLGFAFWLTVFQRVGIAVFYLSAEVHST